MRLRSSGIGSKHQRQQEMIADNRFSVIYSFKVVSGKEAAFVAAWTALTKLIYQYEGSYGSRLHWVDATVYIGYAQWPDKETWEKSRTQLPDSAAEIRSQLRESCSEVNTEFEMEVVMDLLKAAPYKENHD